MANTNSLIPTYSFEYGTYKNKPAMFFIDIVAPGFSLQNPEHKKVIDEEVIPAIGKALAKALNQKPMVAGYQEGDEG